jgi:hypothetical protein
MTPWVIYSTCSIVALCSMGTGAPPTGAADLTVPAPTASAEDASRRPTPAEPTVGRDGADAIR